MRGGRSWLGAAMAVVLAAGLLAGAPAAQAADGDSGTQPRRFVTGWLPYWSPTSSVASVVGHADVFDEASPFWFTATSASEVRLVSSASGLTSAVAAVEAAGVPVVPTVTSSMDAASFAALLSNRTRRAAHVAALVDVARQYGVAGLDLDYESINFGGTSAAKDRIRAKYPVLVDELERALQRKGRLLSVTVPARRSDSDPNWWVYDYARLGAQADRLRLMTYDYSWSGGPAGPIAPVWWVDDVVRYAASRVDPLKISIGVPVYGREWFVKAVSGTCPSAALASVSRTTAQMQAFAAARGITPRWDRASASRTFVYKQRFSSGSQACVAKRRVWFDDARSLRAKLRLVAKHQVRGVALWALGNETPAYWRRAAAFGQAHPVQQSVVAGSFPHSVVYGEQGRIRGKVTTGGTALAGVTVLLRKRPPGGRWLTVATAVTGPRGRVSFLIRPHGHATFRLAVGRAWSHSAARTAEATRVAYAVQLADPARARADGSQFHVSGWVGPRSAGVAVTLQVRGKRGWVDRDTSPVGADGGFGFLVASGGRTVRTYRVVTEAGQLDAGASAPVTIRFR